MGRKYLMSWDGEPNCRWVKMHKGDRYRVSCAELGLPESRWKKEDSYQAANAWWLKKLAELRAAPAPVNDPRREALDVLAQYLKHALPEEVPVFQAQKKALESHPVNTPEADDTPVPPADLHVINENQNILEMFGAVIPPEVPYEILSNILGHGRVHEERVRAAGVVDPDATIGKKLDDWRDILAGRLKASSLREVSDFVNEFKSIRDEDRVVFSADWPVARVNEKVVGDVFRAIRKLKLNPVAQKKRWQRWRQWVTWVCEEGLVESPRNLWSKEYVISIEKHDPKVVSVETARDVLSKLPPRFKLYALLGINCSMNPVDVGSLKKEMINWQKGTITKKRVKTQKKERVPVVTYKMFPETLALLREHLSDHAELALTSSVGTPLYDCKVVDNKAVMNTLLTQQWGDQKTGMTFSDWRDLGANIIYADTRFRSLSILYLGQAPHGVSDVHYLHPPPDILDDALAHVREVLFPSTEDVEKGKKTG